MKKTDERLAKIKENLLKRRQELEEELKKIEEEAVTVEKSADPVDTASAAVMEELKISIHNNKHEEYTRVLKALEMLEKGVYGKCMDCKKPISEKRLKLYPNATRCIVCQENREKSENQ